MISTLSTFFLGPFLKWLPIAVWIALFVYVAGRYYAERRDAGETGIFLKQFSYRTVGWVAITFYGVYALLLSIGQYIVWETSPFTQTFLQKPLDGSLNMIPLIQLLPSVFDTKFGYYLFYVWGHFWFPAVLSIVSAWLFRTVLVFLRKHKDRFFEDGEIELGFVCALVMGWPKIVVFVPLVFLSVVLISIVRRMIWKEQYTTLGIPFLFAVFFTAIAWAWVGSIFNTAVLTL